MSKVRKNHESPAEQEKERPVVITIQIMPVKDGKRGVFMSGAPEGEMPELAFCHFPAIHTVLDQMWFRLRTRKAMVVKGRKVGKDSEDNKELGSEDGVGVEDNVGVEDAGDKGTPSLEDELAGQAGQANRVEEKPKQKVFEFGEGGKLIEVDQEVGNG